MYNKIKLFWWSEIYLMNKTKENFGDLVGKYLVEKISGKEVVFAHPNKQKWKHYFVPVYATAGSILAHVTKHSIVWGSGIINKDQFVKPAKFLSVRGPQTRKRLLELGYEVPEAYGDPALLLPNFYNPEVVKSYKFGIVPHYVDYQSVLEKFSGRSDVKVIDLMTNSVEDVIDEFLSCHYIYSSSLHGLIVSHAYNIPAVWVRLSNKLFGDNIKFQDYFESVGIPIYEPLNKMEFNTESFNQEYSIPNQKSLKKCQKSLIETYPFK